MSKHKPNRLIHAKSPYLLQHAYNPVDWHEWGTEALQKARQEDKPVLVSIGYSACHWCHVMERESFEIQDIADVMNEFFVCVKVDREERPDIDQIYMEAVQALGINGGWPLNVFLTPEQKPFYGGTYFSPQAWVQVLQNINKAFVGNRHKLEASAEDLRLHLLRSDVERFRQDNSDSEWSKDLETIYENLASRFDPQWGGMSKAPKFIMPSLWMFLLRYHHITHNTACLEQITLTLDKIAQGGIYDQVGGGFARYSVDAQWFVPHFEKMLYDNAQLMSLYAEAYALTRDETYKTVVMETFGWLQREMKDRQGGFYSALDADSDGEEGKFYVWGKSELDDVLGEDSPLISSYFCATEKGNWEHNRNILKRSMSDEDFIKEHGLGATQWAAQMKKAKTALHHRRENRNRPSLDDKIITAWNAMMITGLTDAYRVFGDLPLLNNALETMRFIESELADGDQLYRSYKGARSTTYGFLDDYAFVIQAQLRLYQVTFDEHWVHHAGNLMEHALNYFFDHTDGFFFYTSARAEKLIARKKEIFDNVIPSSNAIMAQNLFTLGTLLDREAWQRIASSMTTSLAHVTRTEPNYMSQWAIAYTEINKGMQEVLMVGKGIQELRAKLQEDFLPYVLIQGSTGDSMLPLFAGKTALEGRDTIYVCHGKTCKMPVHTLKAAKELLV